MLRQKFAVQVTTLADCDDITRFDGIWLERLTPDREDVSSNPLCGMNSEL